MSVGEGPPVLLIHGLFLGSLAQWYFTVAPALAPRRRVVMFDLRGHGRSERPASGYDLDTLVGDLQAVLDGEGIEAPVDLVGHSYGGLIALRFAAANPGRVRRLALIDLPLPPGDAALLDPATHGGPEGLLGLLPEESRQLVLGGGRKARRLLQGLRALAEETTLLDDVKHEAPLEDSLIAGIEAPTLLVFGRESACAPAAGRLMAVLPDARLRWVDGGHFVPVEAPARMTEALAEFLDG